MCIACKIPGEKDPYKRELEMADGSVMEIEGKFQLEIRYGKYKGKLIVSVFPNLHKELILEIPWLITNNPADTNARPVG